MKNKINVAELLKDCPKGMELDCSMYDNVTLDCVSFETVSFDGVYPIKVQTPKGELTLTKYGQYFNNDFSNCVIFPKGKTSWEGFVPPCKFKDGDVVATNSGKWIGITTGGIKHKSIPTYCIVKYNGKFEAYLEEKGTWDFDRLATEEEKEKLFKAIKDNGYRWNAEANTLEKLVESKFKVGDRIRMKNDMYNLVSTVTKINEDGSITVNNYKWVIKPEIHYKYELVGKSETPFPLFKVGDRIRRKTGDGGVHTIGYVFDNVYSATNHMVDIPICEQDEYELVHGKFNICTLKPFDKVLVRKGSFESWGIQYFERYETEYKYPYICLGDTHYGQCVPYIGNEYLLNKKFDCDEYYKTWD
jgi:hypothetical protein